MDLRVLKQDKDYVELEVIGEGHTMCNVIRKEIYNEKGDVVAGYNIAHPIVSNPKMIIKGDKPLKLILSAIDRLKDKNKELKSKLKKL